MTQKKRATSVGNAVNPNKNDVALQVAQTIYQKQSKKTCRPIKART